MTNDFDRNCGNLASALTAFFDGQATPAEVRLARAHLRECAQCAELWLAWEQAQGLLKKDIVSAPPGLAQRVLMACRMEGFRRVAAPGRASAGKRALPPEIVAMTLGLQSFDNFRNDEATEILPPPFLRDAILDLTTRAAAASRDGHAPHVDASRDAKMFDVALYSDDAAHLEQTVLVHSGGGSGYTSRHYIRRAFAFAAPALLLFMMWPGAHSGLAPETGSLVVSPLVSSSDAISHQGVARPIRATSGSRFRAAIVAKANVVFHVAPVLHAGQSIGEQAVESASAAAPSATEVRWTRDSAPVAEPVSSVQRSDAVLIRATGDDMHVRPAAMETVKLESVQPVALPQPMAAVVVPKPVPASRAGGRPVLARLLSARLRAPRLLTTVSFTPVSLRSALVRPALLRTEARASVASDRAMNGEAEGTLEDGNSLDGRLAVTPAIESYSAALAEDVDESEISG